MTRTIASLSGVTRRFGDVVALDRLDLELRRGEILALLGPNGAGKTTAVRVLLGITRIDDGIVEVLGAPPRTARMQGRVGVVLQTASIPQTLRVGEQIEQFRSYYPCPRPFGEILKIAGLEGLERRLFGNLSGGQKQRVLFALALAGNPEIVILDEPTVGLDVEIRRELWQQIDRLRSEGTSVLLTTHYLQEAEALADRVVVIHHGRKIAEGSPEEIAATTSDRRIVCSTKVPAVWLEALPAVSAVRMAGARVELWSRDAETTLRALLDADPNLAELEVSRADLEDAFLSLTEERIA